MTKTQETKLMILENFIDHIETNEVQRQKLKAVALEYIEEDHVDEIASTLETVYKKTASLLTGSMEKKMIKSVLLTIGARAEEMK